jgi:hypothetical protein
MPPRNELKNVQDVWLDGYRRLLAEAQADGHVHMLAAESEHRRHPRFELSTADVTSQDEIELVIENMSRSGLTFLDSNARAQNSTLSLSLAKVLSAEVRIVACEAVPEATEGLSRYRVRCCFVDEGQGLLFVTLALELLRIERE